MADYGYGNTAASSSYSITFNPASGSERPKAPKELITTRAAQTKEGWFGQVFVDTEIVWQSDLVDDGEWAMKKANGYVVDRIKALFRDPDGGPPAVVDGD